MGRHLAARALDVADNGAVRLVHELDAHLRHGTEVSQLSPRRINSTPP
jgi:hypothetical protein